MKRSDDVRAALREAADAIPEFLDGDVVDGDRQDKLLAIARRLRGLERRMLEMAPQVREECPGLYRSGGVGFCGFVDGGSAWCHGLDGAHCPLSRGPVVVHRGKP
jgi:hypothetical protein